MASGASGTSPLVSLSTDPYVNPDAQHATEVEPDSFSFGSTTVTKFPVGRFDGPSVGAATSVGWATSTNSGASWSHGFLSGITTYAGGTHDRATDPAVAYDRRHGAWLISVLTLTGPSASELKGDAILVSRSANGGLAWGGPIVAATAGGNQDLDKPWIVCDTTPTSPYYGRCYLGVTESNSGEILMSTSTDGGLAWSSPISTVASACFAGDYFRDMIDGGTAYDA